MSISSKLAEPMRALASRLASSQGRRDPEDPSTHAPPAGAAPGEHAQPRSTSTSAPQESTLEALADYEARVTGPADGGAPPPAGELD